MTSDGEVDRPLPLGECYKTPDNVIKQLCELNTQGMDSEQIADKLNAEGFSPSMAKSFTGPGVRGLLVRRKIRPVAKARSTKGKAQAST